MVMILFVHRNMRLKSDKTCRVTSTSWAALSWIAWPSTFARFTRSYKVSNSALVGCNDIILCSVICPVCGYQLRKIKLKGIHSSHECMLITFSCENCSLCMQSLHVWVLVIATINLHAFVCVHPTTKILLLTNYHEPPKVFWRILHAILINCVWL